MRNDRFRSALTYILVSLTLTLASCGGEGGGSPPGDTRVGQVSEAKGRTAVLMTLSITPSNHLVSMLAHSSTLAHGAISQTIPCRI